MKRLQLTPLALLAGAALLAGCVDDIQVAEPAPVGQITLAGYDSAGVPRLVPSATFFRIAGVVFPDSRNAEDACQKATVGSGGGPQGNIAAGESVSLRIGSVETRLPQSAQTGLYRLGASQRISFRPGDSAYVTIPGASPGFPSSTVAGRLAEPFVLQPVPAVPAQGQTIPLRWAPPGDATSAMLVVLQYSGGPAGNAGEAITCALVDDGAFDVPASLLTNWRSAGVIERSAVGTRVRTRLARAGNDALLYVSATFTDTTTVTGQTVAGR